MRAFLDYVECVLAPTLNPGDIVGMDNLGSARRPAIRAVGAKLFYLPPYRPDLNPIDQAFAQIKHWSGDAMERTRAGLWRRIGPILEIINPEHCPAYVANSGHGSS